MSDTPESIHLGPLPAEKFNRFGSKDHLFSFDKLRFFHLETLQSIKQALGSWDAAVDDRLADARANSVDDVIEDYELTQEEGVLQRALRARASDLLWQTRGVPYNDDQIEATFAEAESLLGEARALSIGGTAPKILAHGLPSECKAMQDTALLQERRDLRRGALTAVRLAEQEEEAAEAAHVEEQRLAHELFAQQLYTRTEDLLRESRFVGNKEDTWWPISHWPNRERWLEMGGDISKLEDLEVPKPIADEIELGEVWDEIDGALPAAAIVRFYAPELNSVPARRHAVEPEEQNEQIALPRSPAEHLVDDPAANGTGHVLANSTEGNEPASLPPRGRKRKAGEDDDLEDDQSPARPAARKRKGAKRSTAGNSRRAEAVIQPGPVEEVKRRPARGDKSAAKKTTPLETFRRQTRSMTKAEETKAEEPSRRRTRSMKKTSR